MKFFLLIIPTIEPSSKHLILNKLLFILDNNSISPNKLLTSYINILISFLLFMIPVIS